MRSATCFLVVVGVLWTSGCGLVQRIRTESPKTQRPISYATLAVRSDKGEGIAQRHDGLTDDISARIEAYLQDNGFRTVDRDQATSELIMEEMDRCLNSGLHQKEACARVGKMLQADAILHVRITKAGCGKSIGSGIFDAIESVFVARTGGAGTGMKYEARTDLVARIVDVGTSEVVWSSTSAGTDLVFDQYTLGNAPDRSVEELMGGFPKRGGTGVEESSANHRQP